MMIILFFFGQNWVSNRWNVAFVVVVVIVVVVVVVVHVVVIIVVVDPTSPLLKFGQNQVRNSWDINDIEFVVVVGDGWWNKVVFVSNLTFELSWLSWGCDNFLNQNFFGRNFFLPKSFMDPILLVLKFWDMDCFWINLFLIQLFLDINNNNNNNHNHNFNGLWHNWN